MKKFVVKLALAPLSLPLLILGYSAYASVAEDDSDLSANASANSTISINVSVDYVSEYVFRGVTLAGGAFQPGAEISTSAMGGNFTAGVWASVASGEESNSFADEIDFYVDYGFDLNESMSANVGAVLYHYPQSGGLFDIGANDAGTVEIYGGLGFDAALAPSVTAFYDLNLKAFTLEGGAEHSFPLGEKTSFDVGVAAGLVTVDGAGDYQYGSLSGALSYGFNDISSVYVGVNGGLSSQNTFLDTNFDITNPATISAPNKSSIWFGVGISSGF